MNKPGIFITFEGIDGSGKSTQARLLYDLLTKRGYDLTFLREPGGTKVSEHIRKILLDRKNDSISPQTELLLYLAARAEVVDKIIAPALAAGRIVVADRFYDSTFAYQVYGRGLPVRIVRTANKFASAALTPDLTFLVDLPVRAAQRRLHRAKDRLEAEGVRFQERVRRGFLQLAQAQPRRIKVLNGGKRIEDIFTQVEERTIRLLRRRKVEPRA
ncbi:MAG: dTMP kinase [candidate division Zixibacteria bacterium]|nr:dTMP kinase [candidate division Zixibacteria bacterium]